MKTDNEKEWTRSPAIGGKLEAWGIKLICVALIPLATRLFPG